MLKMWLVIDYVINIMFPQSIKPTVYERAVVYGIGSFIQYFDDIVHRTVFQAFCYTRKPALVLIAQVVGVTVTAPAIGKKWTRSTFASDKAVKILYRLTRLSWKVDRPVWSRARRYDWSGKMVLSEERWTASSRSRCLAVML